MIFNASPILEALIHLYVYAGNNCYLAFEFQRFNH